MVRSKDSPFEPVGAMAKLEILERRKEIADQQQTRGHDQNRKEDLDVHLAHPSSAAFDVAAFPLSLSRSPDFDR